jgi:hypothetical protein
MKDTSPFEHIYQRISSRHDSNTVWQQLLLLLLMLPASLSHSQSASMTTFIINTKRWEPCCSHDGGRKWWWELTCAGPRVGLWFCEAEGVTIMDVLHHVADMVSCDRIQVGWGDTAPI